MTTEDLIVDGLPARRGEEVGVGGGFMPLGSISYSYAIALDGQFPEEGQPGAVLVATVAWQIGQDAEAYAVHRAVLDRMMASLEFAAAP